ncbi:hypothetical protein [Bacillus niameyensis]|uniref:hypothetical protein n=1 Tax=Bacillus niameyensis TaxID=1522308 RepID=UPI00078674ED|nr:hypothetical protein [Bacillus niameyensis]
MKIRLIRDSVAMGDDVYAPNEKVIEIPATFTLEELVKQVKEIHYLPSIYGGKATWVLYEDFNRPPLVVLAQQWEKAKFLVDSSQTLSDLFLGKDQGVFFFRYLLQRDPDEVFQSFKQE